MRGAAGVFVLLVSATAYAQSDNLDLYQGTVVGSPRVVGMGGTVAAAAEDMTGTLGNPASLAFRPVGGIGSWDWDFYLDALASSRDTDISNSGLEKGSGLASQVFAGGLAFYVGRWGFGASAVGVDYALPRAMTGAPATTLGVAASQITVGRSVWGGQLGLGLSIVDAQLSITQNDVQLFNLSGLTLGGGAIWRPPTRPWRLGLSGRLPAFASDIATSCGEPADCAGIVPPTRGQAPWQLLLGFAWRFGAATWNDPNPVLFRDEEAFVLAADVGVIGPIPDGVSVAGFAAQMPQRSGTTANLSARVGVDAAVVPAWLRLRAGAYWEPGRIEGRDGRVHVTAGLEARFFKFQFRAKERRLRVAFAIDMSESYRNAGVSVGFWH
jgi:hypothetical protein